MKSRKIKINWKPPEVTVDEKRHTKSQDQINAELNELATATTEWYVEGEKHGTTQFHN